MSRCQTGCARPKFRHGCLFQRTPASECRDGNSGKGGEIPAAPGHRAYNVASGHPRSVGELAAELCRACHGPTPVVVGGGRPGDVRHVVADPHRIRDELGFTARGPFEAGVEEFATAGMRG